MKTTTKVFWGSLAVSGVSGGLCALFGVPEPVFFFLVLPCVIGLSVWAGYQAEEKDKERENAANMDQAVKEALIKMASREEGQAITPRALRPDPYSPANLRAVEEALATLEAFKRQAAASAVGKH